MVLPKVAEEGAIKLVDEEQDAAPAYEVDIKEELPEYIVVVKA